MRGYLNISGQMNFCSEYLLECYFLFDMRQFIVQDLLSPTLYSWAFQEEITFALLLEWEENVL